MIESDDFRDTLPPLTRPDDFYDFWDASLQSLSTEAYDIQFSQQKKTDTGLHLQWLQFRSLNGAVIHGYCLSWQDDTPRPLVIHTHGYVGQSEEMWHWARQGLHVFGFDLRGMGRSRNAIATVAKEGYVLTGIENPHHSVLRGAVCDYLRAADIALELVSTARVKRLLFYGYSFGGALALMATAVSQRPEMLVSAVPTLGWADGRRKLVKDGSGYEINRYLASHKHKEAAVMHGLRYFDTMNFADRVRCPTLMGLGLRDRIVPAATVYAIINHMTCPLVIREYPVSHTTEPEEQRWQEYEAEWLKLAFNGVSASFAHTQG